MEDSIVQILHDYRKGRPIDQKETGRCPDRSAVIDLTKQLLAVIFPCCTDLEPAELLENTFFALTGMIGTKKTRQFFDKIPLVRAISQTDVDAAFSGDPAATGPEEIILCYPGLYATTVYRLAHELQLLQIPMLPRIMTEYAHSITGIDIHPGATIGGHFFIDHGTGIVIGETTRIGEHVKIYQGVTLGGLSTRGGQHLRGRKRHPTVEDNVTIYANASILGGETVIGCNSVIGAGTFITASVPPGSVISHRSVTA